MKRFTLLYILLFISFYGFAQDTEPPTTPYNVFFVPLAGPQGVILQWEQATDNVGVTEYEIYVNDTYLETVAYGMYNTQHVAYGNLANGTYCYKIRAKDAAGNSSVFTNELCRTIDYNDDPGELYISGILNYSNANRAIEISNITDNEINLSSYSIKISHDGSPTWAQTYTFPENTILGVYEAFVTANSNTTICTDEINDYNDVITSFDGNDVIGLFKNDVLIDIIGELGSDATTIDDNTFLKVTFMTYDLPNTTYNPIRWEIQYNNDTNNCTIDLGYVVLYVLDTEEVETNTFQMYPNPATGNTLQFNTKNNQTIDLVTIIDINGRNVLTSTTILNNQLDIKNIKPGIYFVKIQSGNKTSTHKLIRQ